MNLAIEVSLPQKNVSLSCSSLFETVGASNQSLIIS